VRTAKVSGEDQTLFLFCDHHINKKVSRKDAKIRSFFAVFASGFAPLRETSLLM
jgi:hypothetical protein